jgi:anti-anti-sigma factor
LIHRFRKERANVSTLEGVRVASSNAGVVVVCVSDEQDLATKTELSAFLHALIRQNDLVVVDFSDTLFVDSSTLSVLVSAHKLALERGASLRLQLRDDCAVKRTFEISGLLNTLSWASSREEALNGSADGVERAAEERDGSRDGR